MDRRGEGEAGLGGNNGVDELGGAHAGFEVTKGQTARELTAGNLRVHLQRGLGQRSRYGEQLTFITEVDKISQQKRA